MAWGTTCRPLCDCRWPRASPISSGALKAIEWLAFRAPKRDSCVDALLARGDDGAAASARFAGPFVNPQALGRIGPARCAPQSGIKGDSATRFRRNIGQRECTRVAQQREDLVVGH